MDPVTTPAATSAVTAVLTYFAAFGALATTVWGATEGIGRATGLRKDLVALVAGPVGGLLMYASHMVDVPRGVPGWAAWSMSAFAGLMATFLAGQINDRGVKALPTKENPAKGEAP